MKNPVLRVLIRRLAEFIIFLLILILLNIAINYVNIPFLQETAIFLNQSVPFLGLIALIMLFGEIFSILKFPFNLPYPLFNSLGVVFMISFIFDLFTFLIQESSIDLDIPLDMIFLVISVLVVVIILITGYYHILADFFRQQKRKSDDDSEEDNEEVEEPVIKPKKTAKVKKKVTVKKTSKKKIKKK